jgi:hypothetical protein
MHISLQSSSILCNPCFALNSKWTFLYFSKYSHFTKRWYLILSYGQGSLTNNNGFWIGWLDLLALLLQFHLITVTTAHNRWLPKTRSISYWTTIFSSIVTDFVLIYESITSSASIFHWLTLHSWTLYFWILLRLTHDNFSFMNEWW